MDGKRYLQQGFDVLAGGLSKAGWKQVTANESPDEKNRTFAHSPFMYSGGERGGPMATYLVTAAQRSNFKLWTNTTVRRVLRNGGHVTGVEVEARPPGKKVKRLSLLSGGERSLTAVALLVAIFRARPSPFYVLDEVEAALDDVNLGRLLTLIEQLRSTSQLIVITHQKRTMEVGDAPYGVTMRGDGVSTVISQRLRDAEPEGRGRGVDGGRASRTTEPARA